MRNAKVWEITCALFFFVHGRVLWTSHQAVLMALSLSNWFNSVSLQLLTPQLALFPEGSALIAETSMTCRHDRVCVCTISHRQSTSPSGSWSGSVSQHRDNRPAQEQEEPAQMERAQIHVQIRFMFRFMYFFRFRFCSDSCWIQIHDLWIRHSL